jgi:Tfp pilus assembly protein PilF
VTITSFPKFASIGIHITLDKAGQAKCSGDYAMAKEFYGKVLRESPSNVEAHSGLGDIARAQGDLAGAKAAYKQALASSPDYGPALLSLADTEWDLGDRASAQQRYAKIVAARGGSAPERAKQRAGGENN